MHEIWKEAALTIVFDKSRFYCMFFLSQPELIVYVHTQ